MLERAVDSIKHALSSLLHPGGREENIDEEVVSAWAAADQKKDQQRILQREWEEADARAKELEEQARQARFGF
jgi:hypothetical protein